METPLKIATERVDDLPLLFAKLERMGLARLIDAHFPAHGNWKGLTPGQVTIGWICYILSQADHRMSEVEDWAKHRLHSLSSLFAAPVRALDFSDDRLAAMLKAFSCDTQWEGFEADLNGHLLRVYDLKAKLVRLDATTASGYFTVTDEGLFQFGHSKDRPDLPQVKVMLSTLDPLGLPLATQVLSGQRADDLLYLPAIDEVHRAFEQRGLLFVGDSKMAALNTRATIVGGRDFYLCPLPAKHQGDLKALLAPFWENQIPIRAITRTNAEGGTETIAEGFEREHVQIYHAEPEQDPIVWNERQLVIRSLKHAQASEQALDARLEKALLAIEALNVRLQGKKRLRDRAEAQLQVEHIIKRYGVAGLLSVQYQEQRQQRLVRAYRDRPTRLETTCQITLEAEVDCQALASAKRLLGWRIYVTNQAASVLALSEAVLAYRDEYIIEHRIGRLKGQPLSLSPMYLHLDDHVKGLIRLLSLALRVLVLLEYQVRQHLNGESLKGLDRAHRRRKVYRPTAERLLKAFDYITLTVVKTETKPYYHLTPLSELQACILEALDLDRQTYSRLTLQFSKPP